MTDFAQEYRESAEKYKAEAEKLEKECKAQSTVVKALEEKLAAERKTLGKLNDDYCWLASEWISASEMARQIEKGRR